MTELTLYCGLDDNGHEWATIDRETGNPDEPFTIANFYGEGAAVNAQIFMEKRNVISDALAFIQAFDDELNRLEATNTIDDYDTLAKAMRAILNYEPVPEIAIDMEGRG